MLERIRIQILAHQALAWILKHPWPVVVLCVLATAGFAAHLPRLSFQTSIYDLVIEDLPETQTNEQFKEIFGFDEMIRVVIRAGDVFDPATFARITALSDAAENIVGVRRVIGLPEIRKAIDIRGKWPMEKFAAVAAPVDLFKKNILSEDRKTTVLTLLLEKDANPDAVIADVDALIAGQGASLSLYQIGMPLISRALVDYTQKDFFRLPPVALFIIATVLFLLLKNVQGLVLSMGCVLAALTWTFGFMAMTGIPVSMLTMIVPVFLLAVGTAYCLHVVSDYLSTCHATDDMGEAVMHTYSRVAFPTILAVLTTIIGLGSLLVNRIPAIRVFALFSCFGMISLLILVMTLMPAMMVLFPNPKPPAAAESKGGRLRPVEAIIRAIVRINMKHQAVSLPIIGVFSLIALFGVFRLRVETNPVGYFRKDVPVIRHFHDIYRDLSGSFPVYVMMTGPAADYFEKANHVASLAKLQTYLATLPGIDKTVSFADYAKLVNYATNRFEPAYYKLPEEDWELRMLINNFKPVLGEEMFNRFMTEDLSRAGILMMTHLSSSAAFLQTRKEILKYVGSHFSKDLSWDVTGFGIVISASSDLLTSGQLKSLSITMVLVFGIMFLLFLSGKVGLIAAATNLFPIVTLFGVMGWAGIELSMATALIASIAIGLAVDDTIHYLVRYNREFRKDLNEERALRDALGNVGRPMIFTTLTISLGFSILMLSSFQPTAVFGMMMAVTMVSALVGDSILLPTLIRNVQLVTLWDLVRLKLGKEPRYGIPLFAGLSRSQVHYICMAGTLKNLAVGEVLFRKGEPSDSMFAVISGKMDVLDHALNPEGEAGGFRKRLFTLKPGDVVGEMGLLRSAPRSASVVAVTEGELLQINLTMIRRLQWLYPPTAHKFFFNLLRILCDRIENVSHCLFEASMVDDLTGLCNRKSFMAQAEKEIQRSRRYRLPLTLCLLRVANGGQPAAAAALADKHLVALSSLMMKHLRMCDTLGRLDEETFAVLMPQTTEDSAGSLVRRLKSICFGKTEDGARLPVDLRCGLASISELTESESVQTLLMRAMNHLTKRPEPG